MVVCKYFLSGSCKFGNNCVNEHPGSQISNTATRYKYVSPNYKSTNQPTINQDVNQYLDLVKTDANQWLNSSQWKFTCYSPFNNDRSLPMFEDYSPEELRFETYKSRNTNTFTQTIDEINRKRNMIVNYLKEIIHLTPQMRDILIKYYDEINCNPKDMSNQGTQANTTNNFTNLIQKASQANVFATSGTQAASNGIFSLATSQSQTDQTLKPFASFTTSSQSPFTTTPSQNQFTQLMFSAQVQQQQQQILPNPFTQISTQKTLLSPFIQPTQNKVEQNNFSAIMNHQTNNNQITNLQSTHITVAQPPQQQQQQQQQQLSINNTSNNAFSNLIFKNNQNQISNNNQIQSSYYSNKSELNDQDIQEYNAKDFTLGKIPILPPSKDFC